ncbi:hypothetical protein [Corallococcus coralloides]
MRCATACPSSPSRSP